MEGVQLSSVAGRDINKSMTVWEKRPIYSDDDGDWQVEIEREELASVAFYRYG